MLNNDSEPKIYACKFCNTKVFLYNQIRDTMYCGNCGATLFAGVKSGYKIIHAVEVNTWIERYYS